MYDLGFTDLNTDLRFTMDSLTENIFLEEIYQVPSKITVIISQPWSNLKEDQRLLLSKILQSVKLSLESVRIIHQSTFDITSLREKPSRMVAFIAPPKGLALYEVIQTGETSMIFSDPFDTLITDEAAKRKLWSALRTLFST